jgi:WD40 repeat protein/transcriptional regulator with XRE-family HTH domain
MALEEFRAKLKDYLRQAGYSQKQLAYVLGMHPAQLSNKLNEHNYANLTLNEVKQVIKVLAEWQALNTTQEALELLALMRLNPHSFSQTEWASPPLNLLTQTAPDLAPAKTKLTSGPSAKASLKGSKRLELFLPQASPTLPPASNGTTFSPPLPLATVTSRVRREEGLGTPAQFKTLYGRQQELNWLAQAVLQQKARLVSLTGLGGIGKTSLAFKLSEQVKPNFEYVIWYSLWNAPPPQTAFSYFLDILLGVEQLKPTGAEVHRQLYWLLECLKQARCLLILDNFETVLAGGKQTGTYLDGYEEYGRLLELVGNEPHQSCVVLTSREKPKELRRMQARYPEQVICLGLTGLGWEEGRKLLEETSQGRGGVLQGSAEEWATLVSYYSGNPLALKLLSEPLQMVFGGSLSAFLAEKWGVFTDIQSLLDQQFERLIEVERELLFWLAVERQPMSLGELKAGFRRAVSSKELSEGLVSLTGRFLIETTGPAGYFGLQPVVLEYLTEQLIKQVAEEISQMQFGPFLGNYALLKAETKDYIRQSQRKLLVWPILDRLKSKLKTRQLLSERLYTLIELVRERALEDQGYEGGNVINLLVELKADLSGVDFSRLRIWQAYLQGVTLAGVNMAWSDLRGSLFTNAFSSVEAVAFSPDGTTLASAGLEGTIRLWEATTSKCLAVFSGHRGRVWSIAFSPDGLTLASGSADATVRLWDLASGWCHQTYKGHTNEVKAVAFSPDGLTLASGSSDATIRVWEVGSGQCLKVLEGHNDEIWSVAFHPAGTLLASGSADATVGVWEVATGQCTMVLTGELNRVWAVAFSPDGQLLASGNADHTIRLWEIKSGHCLKLLRGHSNRVYAVAFSPDGTLIASGSSDQTIRVWEVESGECLRVLQGHHNLIKSLAFSPNGELLLSGSPDQSIRLWQVESGLCVRTYEGYSSVINSVVYSPDGSYLASGSDDKTVRLWEVASGRLLKTLGEHSSFVKSLAFSPNGRTLASGSADHTVRLWEVKSWQCFRVLEGYPSWIWSVAFSPDGQILAGAGNDNVIYLWDSTSGQRLKVLEGHTNHIKQVTFSPDGKLLASGSTDQTVRVWEVGSGECLSTFEGQENYSVLTIAFSPDGKLLASGSADQTVRLWELTSKRCLKILQAHHNWVGAVAFSPDGRYLASSGYDNRVVIWDAKSWGYLFELEGQTGLVRSLAFNPASSHIAGGDEHYGRVWDLASREVVQVMKNPGPYEGLCILGVQGLSAVQEANLVALGAIRNDVVPK